jgi:hypothetical protein
VAFLANSIADMSDELAARWAPLQRDCAPHAREAGAASRVGARSAVVNLRERLPAEGCGDGR